MLEKIIIKMPKIMMTKKKIKIRKITKTKITSVIKVKKIYKKIKK